MRVGFRIDVCRVLETGTRETVHYSVSRTLVAASLAQAWQIVAGMAADMCEKEIDVRCIDLISRAD